MDPAISTTNSEPATDTTPGMMPTSANAMGLNSSKPGCYGEVFRGGGLGHPIGPQKNPSFGPRKKI